MLSNLEQKQFTRVCWEHIWAAVGMHALYRAGGSEADARSAAVSVRDLIAVAPAYRQCWELIRPTVKAQGFDSFIAIVEDKSAAIRAAAKKKAETTSTEAGKLLQVKPPRRPSSRRKPSLPLAKLRVISGRFAGRELELNKTITQFGRDGRQLVAITRQDGGYSIVSVDRGGSGRGPLVNGAPIGPSALALRNNDVVEIAGIKAKFAMM